MVVDEVHSNQLFTAHTAELLEGGDYTLWVESRGGDAEGPLQRDGCRIKYLRVVDPAPTLTGINSPEQESPGIEWDSGIEMHGTGLALGSGDKVEAKLEGDPSAQWHDLTGYVDGEGSGAELIVLGGDSWEVLGDDVGLDADHTSARFRVTVGGQSAEIVGTALVP